MKKILLTGSTGLAGTSILRRMLDDEQGSRIRACYHNTGPVVKDKAIEYVQADLRSLDDCRKITSGCDCAVMAAGFTGGAGFLREFAWRHMSENLMMNVNMLEAARQNGLKRIIIIGSATLYQDFQGSISEDQLDLTKDPSRSYIGYGWAMRLIEKLGRFLNEQSGTEVIMVRLGNLFGPYAKFDPEFSNFIPAIIRKAVDKRDPFEVWGSPDVARDVLYSEDFARAISMMTKAGMAGGFEAFNLGSGGATTVGSVVDCALKYAGHTPSEIKYVQERPTTYKFRQLDCAKIKDFLGWQPQYTTEDGIRKTTEWWARHKRDWKR